MNASEHRGQRERVRESGRIESVAAVIAVDVNTESVREMLGVSIEPSEAGRCFHAR